VLPPEACEVLDQGLADYAGLEAWIGIAWVPKDPDHPYHRERQAALEDWRRQEAERELTAFTESLPIRYRRYTLDTIRVHDGNRAAVNAARDLQPGQNLYLHGPAGNGKTHLAIATGRHLAEKGHRVAFHGVVALFARIRSSFAPDGPPRPNLEHPDILILDDLGKVKPTEWVFQEFYATLEHRWSNEKTTIFTANHRPLDAANQLAPDPQSAAAILSRMASGAVIEVKGPDQRITR
jgi:DNA replication protein DnaC